MGSGGRKSIWWGGWGDRRNLVMQQNEVRDEDDMGQKRILGVRGSMFVCDGSAYDDVYIGHPHGR